MSSPLRVTCIAPYPLRSVGGQRFRFEQWFDLAHADRIHLRFLPLWSLQEYQTISRSGAHARKVSVTVRAASRRVVQSATLGADVVLLFREALPLGPPWVERWITARMPVVYDFDDAIYLGDVSEQHALVAPLKMPGKVATIVRRATTTTVGNAHLAAWASAFSDDVVVIPTTLDIERYRPGPVPPPEPVTIGWSGSPTTAKHLETIAPALREVTNRARDVEFHAYGAPDYVIPDAARVRASAWSEATELAVTRSFHIGVMPLPDDSWSRGKCGFKALLCMSLGIPVVASPVGVNATIIEHGVNGLLAETQQEWVDALEALVTDPGLRGRLGAAGRQTVVEQYSGQRWAPVFLDVLERAAG